VLEKIGTDEDIFTTVLRIVGSGYSHNPFSVSMFGQQEQLVPKTSIIGF
jgi:hypothetical protein